MQHSCGDPSGDRTTDPSRSDPFLCRTRCQTSLVSVLVSCWEKVRRQKKGFRALWLILAFEIKYGLAPAWGPSLTWWVPARQMITHSYFIPIVLVSDVRERKSIQRGEAWCCCSILLSQELQSYRISNPSVFRKKWACGSVGIEITGTSRLPCTPTPPNDCLIFSVSGVGEDFVDVAR